MQYLEKFNAMKYAIQECHKVDEIKLIRDKAEAWRYALIQAGESIEWILRAEEIKLRAERRAGGILKEMPKARGGQPYQKLYPFEPQRGREETFAEMKITYRQSFDWQRIDSIPEKKFEGYIIIKYKTKKQITTSGVIKLAKELERNKRINDEKKHRAIKISDVDIRKGDFKEVLGDIYNIDAIITDPPYPKKYIQCFSDLSVFANKHLKDDGFAVVYSGQYHLPEVIKRLSEHLIYVWIFCLYHKGKKQLVNGVNIMCGWKPVLIFSKGRKKMRFSAYDVLISEQREKYSHKWQQSKSGVASLIDIFSKPNELIVDPFCGSGTFGIVSQKLGRRFIGADL